MIREAIGAGQYYPDNADELSTAIRNSFELPLGPGWEPDSQPKPKHVLKGLISPHGPYRCAGYGMAHAYSRLKENGSSKTLYMLAPSHNFNTANFAAFEDVVYRTPLGDIEADNEATSKLLKLAPDIIDYPSAHTWEFSLELQLPYVQTIMPEAKVVPIICGCIPTDRYGMDIIQRTGEAYAQLLADTSAVMIASSNLMDKVSSTTANIVDEQIIEALLSLDPIRLAARVSELNATICGLVPCLVMLYAMNALGSVSSEQLVHYTSGDVANGDQSCTVGMTSLAFYKE